MRFFDMFSKKMRGAAPLSGVYSMNVVLRISFMTEKERHIAPLFINGERKRGL